MSISRRLSLRHCTGHLARTGNRRCGADMLTRACTSQVAAVPDADVIAQAVPQRVGRSEASWRTRKPDEATIARRGAGAPHHHGDRRRRLHPRRAGHGLVLLPPGPAALPLCGQVHHRAHHLAAARRRRGRGRRDGPEAECQHEMFVLIRWERRTLAVPLAQLKGIAMDDQTRQVIEDWHYWVAQGYE